MPTFIWGLGPALAAESLNWAEYLSWRDPPIRSYDQYLLTDPPPTGGSQFATGLQFADGAPKATYTAFRMPIFLPVTRSAHGQALEVWGCVRPAYAAGRSTGAPPAVRIGLRAA